MSNPEDSVFTRRYVLFLCAILCTLLWGSAYPAIKSGYTLLGIARDDIPAQMLFAGYRFLLAGLLLLLLAKLTGKSLGFSSMAQLRQTSILGLTQTMLQYIFFYIGLAHATGVKASILNATGTFFSVLLAHVIYHNDRLNHRKALGCIFGFAGVLAVNFNNSLLDVEVSLYGEGFIVIAAFILAAASIYGKHISQQMDVLLMTAWQLAIGGVALMLLGWGTGGHLGHFDWQSTLLLIYLALLSSAAFALWGTLLKYNPVGMVTIFNFLVPVFGVLLSAVFLGETMMEWKYLMALLLVCGGIYLVTRLPQKSGAINIHNAKNNDI
ncbi:DMT family transporter [Cellvibrio japonicus]|uniref:Integral membrane protein n=1 Tax=Cellvibrio japonicus (strain Ueda107) TaxID=498211 RepID=B3PIN4_CELJU|nr:DMT family transporter [Cellvibrio japonicus]ACE83362.1 integral membrane protein [Cellvibrio japonicus Ueda107]QEI13953.1 DMT family transporter [Cellvibrio japonicus]QEI17527.1 DMT family transporter [Cellvibrio japonicus]QEI21103.1 DMT family transporter [Cellvibrio japonicus]